MRKRWIASWNKPELVEVTGAQEMHVRKKFATVAKMTKGRNKIATTSTTTTITTS